MGVDTVRWYTPMTPEDEEKEKARVSHLSAEEKDQELRDLNRQLARLEKLKGINTGELYTWSGRYKALMRDYGFPLFVWYWCCWFSMGVMVYGAIDLGGLDAMMIISKSDNALSQLTGSHWALAEKIDPQLGQIGVTLVLNELLEPIRLPFVVVTLKPAVEFINPPKY
eukprot:CAMPEP_0113620998 /NCGR_PEP_ID=MMETSP0017_2-20120614/10716_1 /TAXON_ID=2856 /ORGANISM="Cylindrotheca closterium" /LENGTH=167 /DNA_ID=CAMNT_0000530705 /DNA_START=184 /DNA_END=687 /DNA_ORIENTATION=+ /assembly_acc=CAM_ASM_000147